MTKAPSRALLRAALVLWVARAGLALFASYPLARTLSAIGADLRPEGDASLFAPGGFLLLDTLNVGMAPARSAMKSAAQGSLVLSVVALGPLALAMGSLAFRQARWSDLFGNAVRSLPRFVLFSGATLFFQAIAIAIAALLHGVMTPLSSGIIDERIPTLMTAGAVVAGAVLVLGLGLIQDLMRAGVVLGTAPSAKAIIRMALGIFGKRPAAVIAGWTGPALLQVLLVALGARLAQWIDVARPGAGRIAAVALMHQGVVFACCALRSVWLSRSIDLVVHAMPIAASPSIDPSGGSRTALSG